MSSGTFDGVQPTGGNGNAETRSANPSSPHFRRPPLVEFAISIQFEPLTKFSFAEIGPLWDHFRDPFNRIEYHPQAPPTFEMSWSKPIYTAASILVCIACLYSKGVASR